MDSSGKLRRSSRVKVVSHSPNMSTVLSRSVKKKLPIKHKTCVCAPSSELSHTEFPLVWSELRNNMQLCDGIVKCDDNMEFKVHRAILSAVSPFFKALFLNTINRDAPEVSEVFVKVPGYIFSLILDYAYSGQCEVSNENVQALLAYADQLEVLGIVQLCCEYILDSLNCSTCLEILMIGRLFFCRDLEERGRKYVQSHFQDVMEYNRDFYNLTEGDLFEILSDDELNTRSEEMVFEAIRKWVEHSPEERKASIPRLLTCVRLGLLACKYYTSQVLTWKYIQNEKCQDVLEKATLYLSSLPSEQISFTSADSITRPRVPYEVMFAVGGWSAGSPTSFIETYDARADRWLLCVNTDVSPRAYHGLCTLHDLVYMIGGFDGNEHYNTVRSFNPVTREWKEHACMYYPRCYVSVATHDGKIYAMGGYNGRSRMNSVERYEPETNQWELIASMQRQRSDASAAVLQDKIYIVGGFNGTEVLRSAEVYDPRLNQWSHISPMLEARSGVSLVAFGDSLYAFGGFNGFTRLTSAERFTPMQSDWTEVTNMLNPRSNFASVVLDQMIYVIGGFNGTTTITNVECYDVSGNVWLEVTPMNLNRSALSACVLAGLPNAREYSYVYMHNKNSGMPEAEMNNSVPRLEAS